MVVGDVMAGRRSVVTESELKFKCVGRGFDSRQLHQNGITWFESTVSGEIKTANYRPDTQVS